MMAEAARRGQGQETRRIRGSRVVDTAWLTQRGWPAIERGRHRAGRRGKVHVSAYMPKLRVLDFSGAPIVIALLSLLAGIAVIAVGVVLLALVILAALQLVGTL